MATITSDAKISPVKPESRNSIGKMIGDIFSPKKSPGSLPAATSATGLTDGQTTPGPGEGSLDVAAGALDSLLAEESITVAAETESAPPTVLPTAVVPADPAAVNTAMDLVQQKWLELQALSKEHLDPLVLKSKEYLVPLWEQFKQMFLAQLAMLKDKAGPLLLAAKEKLDPILVTAQEKMAPYVAKAVEYKDLALEKMEPQMAVAREWIAKAQETMKPFVEKMIAEITAKYAELKEMAEQAAIAGFEFAKEHGMVAVRKSEAWIREEGAKAARISLNWIEERKEEITKEADRHARFTQKVLDGAVKGGANAHKTAAQVHQLRRNQQMADAVLVDATKMEDMKRAAFAKEALGRLEVLATEGEKLALLKVEALAQEDYSTASKYHTEFQEMFAESTELMSQVQADVMPPMGSTPPDPPGPHGGSGSGEEAVEKREERVSAPGQLDIGHE